MSGDSRDRKGHVSVSSSFSLRIQCKKGTAKVRLGAVRSETRQRRGLGETGAAKAGSAGAGRVSRQSGHR